MAHDSTYCETRMKALQTELEQINASIPKLQGQLEQLTSRRLMLHGALLELQDLVKQQNGKVAEPSEAVIAESV